MAARVEWDRAHKVALQYREDHWDEPVPTGTTRSETAETEWVDVEDDLPEDYLPQFHGLLGPNVEFYESDDGSVHRRWPNADFSEDRVREAVAMRVVREAADVLHLTDQIVLEAMEKNEPIPLDVSRARDEARSKRVSDIQVAEEAGIEKVVDFVPDYDDLREKSRDAMMNSQRPRKPRPPRPKKNAR